MKDRTFTLAIAGFPYGGNGGISNEYPGVRNFLIDTVRKANKDPRIDVVHQRDFSDTPITMTRNASVLWARQVGADFLLMVDSDMDPDCERREDSEAKPFWDTSFEFCVEHYDKGPNVVCAPYCGPPPFSNVYVFYWGVPDHNDPNTRWKIEAYSREEASRMRGIQPCAAQPTGLILFDMRAFELTDPMPHYQELLKKHPKEVALAMTKPWFYYEYPSVYEAQKDSTEDVTATRDMSFHGHLKYGRDILYCNWDAWAGHVKPTVVRKPRTISAGDISGKYRHAVETKQSSDKRIFVGAGEPKRHSTNGKHEEQPIAHVLEEKVADDGIIRIGMHTPKQDLDALSEIVKQCQPKLAVEVGSWVGESALAIAKHLPMSCELICVDTFEGSPTDKTSQFVAEHSKDAVKSAFRKNTASLPKGKIILWENTSSQAVSRIKKWIRPDCIDFLYLDADHEYEFVKHQILEWLPLMSPEGTIAGHDFGGDFFGVERAVQEIFETFQSSDHHTVWCAKVQDVKDQYKHLIKHEPVTA